MLLTPYPSSQFQTLNPYNADWPVPDPSHHLPAIPGAVDPCPRVLNGDPRGSRPPPASDPRRRAPTINPLSSSPQRRPSTRSRHPPAIPESSTESPNRQSPVILDGEPRRISCHSPDASNEIGGALGNERDSSGLASTTRQKKKGKGQAEFDMFVDSSDAIQPVKSELEIYLEEQIMRPKAEGSGTKFDALEWWKLNVMKFPILSKVARDILYIPITTLSSESAFSTGGQVLNDFRSSLSPEVVEALVCGGNWIRELSTNTTNHVMESVFVKIPESM